MYVIAHQDADGRRTYLDSRDRFNKSLHSNQHSRTLRFRDLESTLELAESYDALVLKETMSGGLVPV